MNVRQASEALIPTRVAFKILGEKLIYKGEQRTREEQCNAQGFDRALDFLDPQGYPSTIEQ